MSPIISLVTGPALPVLGIRGDHTVAKCGNHVTEASGWRAPLPRAKGYGPEIIRQGMHVWTRPRVGPTSFGIFAFLHTQFNDTWGKFSPDGRWMAYAADAAGRSGV